MSNVQSDVGRNSKVILAGGAASALAIAYLAYSYAAPSQSAQSSVGAIPTGRGTPAAESARYSDVLQKYNVQNAAAATQTGDTYLSVFSARPQSVPEPTPANAPDPLPTPATVPESNVPSTMVATPTVPPVETRNQPRVAEQVQALMASWIPVPHTAARSSEIGVMVQSAPAQNPAPVTDMAAPGGAPPNGIAPRPIIPGFTLVPASLRTDIDTDENSAVEAAISTGAYAGASVFAMGYKRASNSVDMTFTYMTWRGHTYKVNAKPVDQQTLRSALSGQVNNRYISRILIPALALGLGRTGQLFEHADSQTIVTPLGGVIQVRSGPPSGRTIAGTVAGGIATEAGQVLRSDATQLPVKQILIGRGETIGVRFIDPVYPTDEMRPPWQGQSEGTAGAEPAATQATGR